MGRAYRSGLIFGVCCLIVFFHLSARAQEPAITINSIEIQGNRRIEESTIRFYIKLKEGESLTNTQLLEKLRTDVKRVYGLGFFRDVSIEVEPFEGGLRVIYVVAEKPVITRIDITGRDKIKEEKVREKITAKVQSIFSEAAVKESVRNIRLLYQEKGYFFARVEALVRELGPDRVALEFRVDEGGKVWITRLNFTGNEAFSDRKLRKQMETGKKWFLSFITDAGIYKEEALRTDLLRIRLFYEDHGYVRVQVGEPIIREDRKKRELHVTIPIQEGSRYRLKQVTIRGDEETIPAAELREELRLREGEFFSRSMLVKDVEHITDIYATRGYAFVDVRTNTEVDDAAKTVDVILDISRGRQVFIGKIEVKGNTRTRDKVIRREFRMAEGEIYDIEKIKLSRFRLGRLGYFDQAKVVEKKRRGVEDILDLEVEVKERPTGSIAAGGGWSSAENFILTGDIREDNLLGYGKSISLLGRFSSIRTEAELSYTDPYFLDYNFQAGADGFILNREFDNFDADQVGGRLKWGKSLTDWVSVGTEYEYNVTDIKRIAPEAPERIVEQKGKRSTSSITPFVRRDTRDSRFNPTTGSLAEGSLGFAGGPLGGNNDFYRAAVEGRYYYPVGHHLPVSYLNEVVWAARARAQYADSFGGDKLPIYERLYLGGANTVRGYKYRELGPKDAQGDPIGGHSSLLFSTELLVPTPFKPVKLALFFDAGNIYQRSNAFDVSSLRTSAGVGLRFITPIGPIRLDWGWKLDPRRGEGTRELHFSIGSFF